MYNINMFCSCVSRDVFGIKHEDAGWEINRSDKYEINKYANFVSPLFSAYPGCAVDNVAFAEAMAKYEKYHPKEFSNFRWRCKYIDITHSCVEFLKENKADYLVIDSYAATYNYCVLDDGTVITDTEENIIDYLVEEAVIPPVKRRFKFEDITPQELDEKIAIFARNIKSVFKPEQIILIEIKAADLYLQDNEVHGFSQSESINKKMGVYFNALCKYFSDCHIIRTNAIMLGSASHKWGKHPVHYVDEVYYDYYLKKIDLIVDGEGDREQKIKSVDEDFSKIISERYFSCLYHSLHHRVLSKVKILSESKFSKIKTFHGTYMYYNAEQNLLVHSCVAGFGLIPICAVLENYDMFLYFVIDAKVFYVKRILRDGEVELCTEPTYLDVIHVSHEKYSVCIGDAFLSAREDGRFACMQWNKAWEQFSLERF